MANAARGGGVALRPHAKAHKCPDIARLQVDRGAVGVCCQKVDEAAAFVDAGIRDVLVTNEIVAEAKLARLAALARRATLGVLADDAATVARIGACGARGRRDARRAGRGRRRRAPLRRGARRAGGGARARPSRASPACDCGASTPTTAARSTCARRPSARPRSPPPPRCAAASKAAIEAAGLACPVVTGAGTGTWQLERDSRVCDRTAAGLVRLHGRRLPAQRAGPRPARVRAEPLRARDGDESPSRRAARSSTRA